MTPRTKAKQNFGTCIPCFSLSVTALALISQSTHCYRKQFLTAAHYDTCKQTLHSWRSSFLHIYALARSILGKQQAGSVAGKGSGTGRQKGKRGGKVNGEAGREGGKEGGTGIGGEGRERWGVEWGGKGWGLRYGKYDGGKWDGVLQLVKGEGW